MIKFVPKNEKIVEQLESHSLNGEGAQIKLVKDGDKVTEIHILL